MTFLFCHCIWWFKYEMHYAIYIHIYMQNMWKNMYVCKDIIAYMWIFHSLYICYIRDGLVQVVVGWRDSCTQQNKDRYRKREQC